jgi:hypothetical protein
MCQFDQKIVQTSQLLHTVYLRSQSLYSNCSSTNELKYAMESSTKNTLLNDIEPMCETQVISCVSVSHHYPIKWMLDSGASAHFTGSLEDFSSIQMGFFGMVQTASLPQMIQGHGTVLIEHLIVDTETRAKSSHQTKLWPVFYVEGLHMRLISTGQLLWSSLRLDADMSFSTFCDKNNCVVLTGVSGHYNNIHAVLSKILPKESHANVLRPADYSTWHRQLGHPSDSVLNRFCEETKGVPQILIPKSKLVCDGCVKGKLTQKQFPSSESRTSWVLELVHSDLFELPVISYHRYKWTMTLLDDYSSVAFTVMLAKESDAPCEMINILKFLSIQSGQKIKHLHTDQGGEYTSGILEEYLDSEGIQHKMSAPHIHQQNGRAECLNRTLHEKSQAIRLIPGGNSP